MQGMVFLWKTVLWKTTRMLLAAEETPSCSSRRVFLCRLIQKCIKEQMAHSLYEQTEGEWKTQITVWTTFLFYWARNCFRFVFWAAKMQTEEKKRTISNKFAHVNQLFYSFYLCYNPHRNPFFNMGFHTKLSKCLFIMESTRAKGLTFTQKDFQTNNKCACSMHRNDLHDGMFWSEIFAWIIIVHKTLILRPRRWLDCTIKTCSKFESSE